MATANTTHVSEEEENYLRLHLLTGISSRAVRLIFDEEFHPSCLGKTIKKEFRKLDDLKKKKRVINTAQWNLLFPPYGHPDPNSNTFDVTLMVTLLRNLTDQTSSACEYDILPPSTDISRTADLARIKHYRNLLAHFEDKKIESALFTTAWEDISWGKNIIFTKFAADLTCNHYLAEISFNRPSRDDINIFFELAVFLAIGRLGGPDMNKECEMLKTKRLEQSPVPLNIRVQVRRILNQWKENDANFVETRAAKHVLGCVIANSCVTITASSGVGKTAILQHVVLQMAEDGYDVQLVTNPQDIVRFYNPNQKTLLVIDDFCGTYSINQSDLNNWESVMKFIEEIIQNKLTKIIVACRLQVYKDKKFESLSIFRTNVCNLLSEDNSLTQSEKQSIAELYLPTKASKIIQYCNLHDCFPLLCKLYHDNSQLDVTDFFQNPFSVYEAEVEQLEKNEYFGKYCALALCVMFNNRLKEEVLTGGVDKKTKTIIKNTCEECRLNRHTSKLTLLNEFNLLEQTFITVNDGVYRAKHDKLFDFLSYYFGKKSTQCLIKNAHEELIMERFLLESKSDMNQFITVLPPKYHEMYMQRMVDDWFSGNVRAVFCNINMDIPKFRRRFLCYLNTFDKLYQRQLAQTSDVSKNETALLRCCFQGHISFIQWCCDNGVDINLCRYDGVSPLHIASQNGHTEVVNMLLDNKADINKCRYDETSPLMMACYENHVDTVKLLLDNMADVNKCMQNEVSPLYIACQKNHMDIIKLLLDAKADINKATGDEVSPLLIACQEGYKDIVQLLLISKADINMCGSNGVSPLYMTCRNNHVDMVQILLDNKADIDKCTQNEKSPLFIACQKGYKDIVQLLIDNKADINKCKDGEASPVLMACQEGHLDIVQILLNNKADINKCGSNGVSPLYMSCLNNHVDMVQILLENKADIDKCTDDEESPLFIACQKGYKDIVQLLIDNKADINKCAGQDISPLFIACMLGLIDIVQLLLDNEADMSKCTINEESPLLMACLKGYKDIALLLLDNKADINKCNDEEASPLTIACHNGHRDIVQMLLEKKADINKCTNKGESPLFLACMNNHKDIVKILLDNKADINNCANNETSPLSCQEGHLDVVQLLLDNKPDINKCTDNEASPLFISCQEGYLDIVKLLLDNKADINKCMDNEQSPLSMACQKGHLDVVQLLLDNKPDINKCKNDEASPLFISCQE
ncbi:unnamed protein product [Mytilus coruscus]|uniref:Uncharacterized protein n=1 Tax=Mytilus coruscus TaxID=42192 RepID=A0A6J7ZW25_MYTCO|nr:unnamed protein product [Mytilus coruscus]